MDEAFLLLHRGSLALLHRLAAAEDFLEAKVHALLGIGTESSQALYSHLTALVQQRHGPLQVHTLAALLAPLVEHDRALLTTQRRGWLRRDRLRATQVLLRHLAAAVHREQPQFTLVESDGNDGVRTAHGLNLHVVATITIKFLYGPRALVCWSSPCAMPSSHKYDEASLLPCP